MENISFEISDLINSFFGYWSGWHDSWNMLLMKRDGVNYINLFRSFITLYEFLSNEFNRIGVWILHCWRQFFVENFSITFYFHENWEKSMKVSKRKFIVTFSFKNCRIFQFFCDFFWNCFSQTMIYDGKLLLMDFWDTSMLVEIWKSWKIFLIFLIDWKWCIGGRLIVIFINSQLIKFS
jgi:hypothetical protein